MRACVCVCVCACVPPYVHPTTLSSAVPHGPRPGEKKQQETNTTGQNQQDRPETFHCCSITGQTDQMRCTQRALDRMTGQGEEVDKVLNVHRNYKAY